MGKKKGAGPQKQCPECGVSLHAAKRACECGHVFESKPKATKPNVADSTLQGQLRARLVELDDLLNSRDKWEREKQKIEELLETMEK